jgi:hypothetical protein
MAGREGKGAPQRVRLRHAVPIRRSLPARTTTSLTSPPDAPEPGLGAEEASAARGKQYWLGGRSNNTLMGGAEVKRKDANALPKRP